MLTINITQMIVHDMNFKKEGPELANKLLNLNTVPDVVFDFFIKHIETSRNARQIKVCNFTDEKTSVFNKVKTIYHDLTNTAIFIEATRELTKELFNKAKNAGSRSDGALFFILYKHNGEDFFGIMKMDPNEGIQIDTTNFSLKVQENMLPNPNDKLHKCAFIKNVEDINDEVHLYVLDRQQNKGEVSKYFLETFLNAKEKTNDKIMTDRVVKKLNETFINIVPEENALPFQKAMNQTFLSGNRIDLEHDLEGLFTPFVENEAEIEDFIEGFKKELREEHEDAYFQFVADKEPTIIQYSNEKIKIEFPIDFLDTNIFIDENNNSFVMKVSGIKLRKREK